MTTCAHVRFWNEILVLIYFSKTKNVHHDQSVPFLLNSKEFHTRFLSISVTLCDHNSLTRSGQIVFAPFLFYQCLALYKGPILQKCIPILGELDFYTQLMDCRIDLYLVSSN